MKHHRARGKYEAGTVFVQQAEAAGTSRSVGRRAIGRQFVMITAGKVVIDGSLRNCHYRNENSRSN